LQKKCEQEEEKAPSRTVFSPGQPGAPFVGLTSEIAR
jgi:hypothetical protein